MDGQTKEQWEEINFEFNSAILSDGYPSLLRLRISWASTATSV